MSNAPEAAPFSPPAPVPCEFCGEERATQGFVLAPGRVLWNPIGPEHCNCEEAVAALEKEKAERQARVNAEKEAEAARKMQQRVARIVGNSGMNARFLRRTFSTYQVTAENERAFRVCKQYSDTFRDKLPRYNPEPGRNGLFITGTKGTGKTHLAAAIANQLMGEGTPVVCMTMIDLLDSIKQTFAANSDATEASVLKTYKQVPLLIIDDMGKEPATEWAVSKIYAIINARYEAYLPTIVTTNYSDGELVKRLTPKETGDATTADATIDRLREMCSAIVTSGTSWRSK